MDAQSSRLGWTTRELGFFLIACLVWTATCGGVIAFAIRLAQANCKTLALSQARAVFDTVTEFRSWASIHGGVYVPVTDKTRPNPYLPANKRVIQTTDGQRLTLVNPAMMTRQVSDITKQRGGVQIRITSLNPIRPGNSPVGWERNALIAIEGRRTEYARFGSDGTFHYMAPLITEKACLQCHAVQGYREGDIRGGIGVTTPAEPFITTMHNHQRNAISTLSAVWLLGLGLIVMTIRGFRHRRAELMRAEQRALVDPLTSTNNRRGFIHRAEQALRSMVRRHEHGVMMFIDVDCLKEINDIFGHDEGDIALKRVGSLLVQTFRDSDIIARLGGDEFAVLMLDVDAGESAAARQRLEEAIAEENAHSGKPYLISLSIGMVSFQPTDPTQLDAILGDADHAMYTEKRRKSSQPGYPAVIVSRTASGDRSGPPG